jgi:hypothetical protein
LIVTNAICYTHPYFRGRNRAPLCFDEQGVVQMPNWEFALYIHRSAIFYSIWYLVTMIGLIMYFAGYAKLVQLFEDTLTSTGSLKKLAYLFGIAVFLMETIMLVVIWFPVRTVW